MSFDKAAAWDKLVTAFNTHYIANSDFRDIIIGLIAESKYRKFRLNYANSISRYIYADSFGSAISKSNPSFSLLSIQIVNEEEQ